MTKVLIESLKRFPFNWADLNSYRESIAFRKEIYLKDHENLIDGLVSLFYCLFGDSKERLIIYNKSWWDFCLDTWDINLDEYNYDFEGKSLETQEYLKLLIESEIEPKYNGCCTCSDWDKFLNIIIKCITSHKAPYSPIICNLESEYFFYFHYSGSIGIYYAEENAEIELIIKRASEKYIIEE